MQDIKMVVTDLDGTLLRDDKNISEFTISRLEMLHQRKIVFAIATARPVRAVKFFCHGFTMMLGYFTTEQL